MGDLIIPKETSPPADEQKFSGVSLPGRRQHGEFHSPQREPVQLLSFQSEPGGRVSAYSGGTFAPDPLPPPPISIDDKEVELDAEPSALYQMTSEASSHYKKTDLYDDIDKYVDRRQLKRKQSGSCLQFFTLTVAFSALLIGAGGMGVGLYHLTVESHSDCSCEDRIATLEMLLQESRVQTEALTLMVTELQNNIITDPNVPPTNGSIVSRVDGLESQVEDISRVLATLGLVPDDANQTTNGSLENPSSFRNLSLYENCVTTMPSSCSISTTLYTNSGERAFSVCETGTYPLSQSDYYILDVHCGIVNTNLQGDPIITSLNIDEATNRAKCSCYVTHLTDDTRTPECGLYATRCPANYRLAL